MKKQYKDMKLYEVEKCITDIKKEYRDKDVSYTSDIRYQELMLCKKKLTKAKRDKEIKEAKLRDLMWENNNRRDKKLTFDDLWRAVEASV